MSASLFLVFVLMLASWMMSIYRYAWLDTAQRYLSVYIGCAFITDVYASVAAAIVHNNLYLYNASAYFQMPLLCLYFNYSIRGFRRYSIGIWLAALEILLFALNMIYVEPADTFNKNPVVLHSVLVVFMSLYYLLEVMRDESGRSVRTIPGFWIAITLAVYWLTAFGNYSLLNFAQVRSSLLNKYLAISLQGCVILSQCSFLLVFYLLPRMKNTAHAKR